MTEIAPEVARLAAELERAGVRYCHWKSNEAMSRSLSARNDLDLLIDRRDIGAFTACLHTLGYRAARARRQLPGVLDYYRWDETVARVIHVHAHYQLVVGDDTTKNYRIPVESPYLASARTEHLLPTPAPELEYLLLLIRLVLKHCPVDAQLFLKGRPTASERRELVSLAAELDRHALDAELANRFSFLDDDLLALAERALAAGSGHLVRARAGRRMAKALEGFGRESASRDIARKVARRTSDALRARVSPPGKGKKLATGGAMIALVGSDGAGKSTTVDMVAATLGTAFTVHKTHLGKPPRSMLTRLVRRPIEPLRRRGRFTATRQPAWETFEQFPGHVYFLWHTLIARDRYREYHRARQATLRGELVVSDRFPSSALETMDCPRLGSIDTGGRPIAAALARAEARYYQRMLPPDLMIVLRVKPSVAADRRPEQDRDFVLRRAQEVWDHDWTGPGVHVVDADEPAELVQAQVRDLIWSNL